MYTPPLKSINLHILNYICFRGRPPPSRHTTAILKILSINTQNNTTIKPTTDNYCHYYISLYITILTKPNNAHSKHLYSRLTTNPQYPVLSPYLNSHPSRIHSIIKYIIGYAIYPKSLQNRINI